MRGIVAIFIIIASAFVFGAFMRSEVRKHAIRTCFVKNEHAREMVFKCANTGFNNKTSEDVLECKAIAYHLYCEGR